METLGCVSVVCSDKTGTLTQNKMSVTACYTDGRLLPPEELSREAHRSFVEGFALCNDASARIGDPTELALLDMAAGLHVYRPVLETRLPRIDEIPFDSDRK